MPWADAAAISTGRIFSRQFGGIGSECPGGKCLLRRRGYAERTLVYSADAHLQAVLDEYIYLLRHAAQAETVERALTQIGDVWTLSRGGPRTNRAKGTATGC